MVKESSVQENKKMIEIETNHLLVLCEIADETMKREKKLYLDRRYWSNIDID